MKLRPPATPIINIDPYFSVWTEDSVLKNTTHWTGRPNSISGRVFIDNQEYHFLGLKTINEKNIPDMQVKETEIDAFSTVITYINDSIQLKVHFTSPLLAEDLYYASRPVAYCRTSYKSLDGKEHNVKIKFTVSEELVLNTKGEGRALAHAVNIPYTTAIKMGKGTQNVLWRCGDDVRIDWGYIYIGVKGHGKTDHTMLDDMYAIYVESELENEALFFFAYDDIESICYFNDHLKAYWKKDGKTIEDVIAEALNDYNELLSKCNSFSDKIKKEAVSKGNEKYAELLLLAVRQVMAAHKLVTDKDGYILFISKECFSNGCAATVDVTYPSAPFFLLYNTELLKGMLRPVMKYAKSDEWIFDFAPHDVGTYPLLNGQKYGVRRDSNGKADIDIKKQMPVEECGNMIILFEAICEKENDVSFAKQYIEEIKKWNNYLVEFGLDPADQLCTDDFAGHLAHNVNLSVKAIMGIAGYSRILERLGETDEACRMMETARSYAKKLVETAQNDDGSFRLAYDKPDTFSLKYNAVWDKIWKTDLFPKEFYNGEIERYKKELLPYGVPLDSREKYTKSDWLVWVASFAENKNDFNILADSLWAAYNTMRTRAPMTDLYYCDTSHMRGFRHRSVIGGLFIKLLFD